MRLSVSEPGVYSLALIAAFELPLGANNEWIAPQCSPVSTLSAVLYRLRAGKKPIQFYIISLSSYQLPASLQDMSADAQKSSYAAVARDEPKGHSLFTVEPQTGRETPPAESQKQMVHLHFSKREFRRRAL